MAGARIEDLNNGIGAYGGRDNTAGTIAPLLTGPQMTMRQFLQATLVEALGVDPNLVFPNGQMNDAHIPRNNTIFDQLVDTFDDSRFEMIINDARLQELIEADLDIRTLEADGGPLHAYATNGGTAPTWNAFKISLGKLQGLAILKRIRAGDCTGTINAIVTALTQKINTVNEILQENLQSGGGNTKDPYVHKYWKYKFKYELAKYEKDNL